MERVFTSQGFKAQGSELIDYPVHLGNISKYFPVDNMKQTRVNGYFYDFFVDYESIDVDDFLDVHRYFIKKNNRRHV